MKIKKVMYFVVSSALAVGAMFFTGNTVKAMTEKVKKESSQQLVLKQANDLFSDGDLLAKHYSHSSHSSHRSHSSHSSHSSHYSSR